MTEISKRMKIVIVVNIVVAFYLGFIYLILPDTLAKLIDATFYDPHKWQVFGGTCIFLGIFCVIGIKKNEWESFKFFFEFIIIWEIMGFILTLVALIAFSLSALEIAYFWFGSVIMIVLIVINTYFYWQEEK